MKQYFTPEFNQFFKELATNNHKEWFDVHRKRYENYVKKPFFDFVEDLILEMKKQDDTLDAIAKDTIFRINNDVRFSKDKTPYKLHAGASISKGGRKNFNALGLYVHFSPGGCFVASGCYQPEKEVLYKIRQTIAENLDEFQVLLEDKCFQLHFGGFVDSPQNKIIPKEFKIAAEKQPLIFNKQFYFSHNFENEEFVLQQNLMENVLKYYDAARPMNTFLQRAIKN